MKLFNTRDFCQEKQTEYIIGSKEIEKRSIYFVYDEVPNVKKHHIAQDGHAEILFLLCG